MVEEKILRIAAPALYRRMIEIFSSYNIHQYDVNATLLKNEEGHDLTLRFSSDFSQEVTKRFTQEQTQNPDEDVTNFFEEAAAKCKSVMIADYYKMMKL